MNLQDFYGSMKEAMKFFGLRWSEMDQVTLHVTDGRIFLCHGGIEVSFQVEEE